MHIHLVVWKVACAGGSRTCVGAVETVASRSGAWEVPRVSLGDDVIYYSVHLFPTKECLCLGVGMPLGMCAQSTSFHSISPSVKWLQKWPPVFFIFGNLNF